MAINLDMQDNNGNYEEIIEDVSNIDINNIGELDTSNADDGMFAPMEEVSDALVGAVECFKNTQIGKASRAELRKMMDKLQAAKRKIDVNTRMEISIESFNIVSTGYYRMYAEEGIAETGKRVLLALLEKIKQFGKYIAHVFKKLFTKNAASIKIAKEASAAYNWANDDKVREVARLYEKMHSFTDEQIAANFPKNSKKAIEALTELKGKSRLAAELTSGGSVEFNINNIGPSSIEPMEKMKQFVGGIADSKNFVKFISNSNSGNHDNNDGGNDHQPEHRQMPEAANDNASNESYNAYLTFESHNQQLTSALKKRYGELIEIIKHMTNANFGGDNSQTEVKIPFTSRAYDIHYSNTDAGSKLTFTSKAGQVKPSGIKYLPFFADRKKAIETANEITKRGTTLSNILKDCTNSITNARNGIEKNLAASANSRTVGANTSNEVQDYTAISSFYSATLSAISFINEYIVQRDVAVSSYLKACGHLIDAVVPNIKALNDTQ